MSTVTSTGGNGDAAMSETETYDVVLLVEQELSAADAAQVRSLHEGLDEPVTYHVLLPDGGRRGPDRVRDGLARRPARCWRPPPWR